MGNRDRSTVVPARPPAYSYVSLKLAELQFHAATTVRSSQARSKRLTSKERVNVEVSRVFRSVMPSTKL